MISTTGSHLLAVIADAAVRALLFAAVIGLALTVFRIRRAGIRLAAWAVVLVGALAMPLLSEALSQAGWTLPVMTPFNRLLDIQGSTSQQAQAASSLAPSPVQPDRLAALSWIESVVTWQWLALAVYAMGVSVLLLRAVRSWHVTRTLSHHATQISDADALDRMANLAQGIGLNRLPILAESRALRVPATMSVVRPTIVLPATWRNWTASRLDAVLAHELTHVAHRDTLIQRLSLFYRAVVWFSPLSWWLHGRLAELAEEASDEGALTAGSDRAEYAETLLAFFSEAQRTPRADGWHVAMARGAARNAERRVDRILNWKGDQAMKLTTRVLIGTAIVATPIAVVVASVHAWSTPSLPLPEMITVQAEPPATRDWTPPKSTPAPPAKHTPEPTTRIQTPPQTTDEFMAGAYPADTPGLEKPTLIRDVEPKYTSDAIRAKIQGQVEVDLFVRADGTVEKVRVAKARPGESNPSFQAAGSLTEADTLTENALRAGRQFEFSPGRMNGQPVAVVVTVTMAFRIH